MSNSPEPENSQNILGKFASVVGLLGSALFFAGWIYRWAYFSAFQLDLAALDLPAQSFFIVPIQIFLGTPIAIVRTVLVALLAVLTIALTLLVMQRAGTALKNMIQARQPQRRGQNVRQSSASPPAPVWESGGIKLLRSLLTETVIVAWIFIFLFWSARWQGLDDARRDIQNATSTLPVIALVTPLDNSALGRQLKDVFEGAPVDEFAIIGDKGLFDNLRGKEDTDITNPDRPRVWRLLLQHGDWIYVFSALAADAPRDARPLVLVMEKGGGQMMILSPETSQP